MNFLNQLTLKNIKQTNHGFITGLRVTCLATVCSVINSTAIAPAAIAADYPANVDYGTKGDFIVKAGTEFGRTAILMPVGPLLINLPEAPGSSHDTFTDNIYNRARDTVWDLSDLTDPQLFRQITCDVFFAEDQETAILTDENRGCRGNGQPIHAHATVVRFDDTIGPLLYGRNAGDLAYHAEQKGTDGELTDHDTYYNGDYGFDPIGYLHMTAPYFSRNYWQYNFDNQGVFAIRDSSTPLAQTDTENPYTVEGIPELEAFYGPSQLGIWLGEPLVHWNHLAATGVTGFATWLGNLLVFASDQQSTGLAIYDVSGYKEGRTPRLLSVYNEQRTEPNDNKVGVGGYWVEAYGTNKMVYAARQRAGIDVPKRDYSSISIIDFSDPEAPYLSCEIFFDQDEDDPADGDGSTDPMYVNFQDNFAYLDHFKVDMDLCEQHFDDEIISDEEFSEIVYKFEDIANGCDSSQYFRPMGQVGIFGGYDWWGTDDINEQGMCFFVTSDEPDTNAPYIAGHKPLANQTGVPIDTFIHLHIPETLRTETLVGAITVRNTTTNELVSFRQQLAHTGIISVWPDDYLAANTTYEVTVSGIQDYMGNTMTSYSYTFSTHDGDLLNGVTPGIPVTPPEDTPSPTYAGEDMYFPNKSSQISCPAQLHDEDVWVVNPNNDSVAIISSSINAETLVKTHTLSRELTLNYQHPTSVVSINDLHAVTFRDDDKVVFYSSTGLPQFAIDTGHGTQPVAIVTDDEYLYVSLYGSGEVIKINPSTKSIIARLAVGTYPKAMALTGNKLLITRFISAQDHGEVYEVDTADTMSHIRTFTINKILVPDDIDHGSGVPNYLRSIVIDAEGKYAYVTAKKDNTDRGAGTITPSGEAKANPEPLDDDNTVRSIIVTLDLENHRDANTTPDTREYAIDLDNAADPSGISYLANGNVQVFALQGNNLVLLSNTENNTTARFNTGSAPQELCSNTRTLYVKNFTDRTVSAIDVAKYLHEGDISPTTEVISTVQNEVLSTQELRGLELFYHSSIPQMGAEGYMSCASCHDGGGHDGRTWDITSMGEGHRNTMSLNGASGTRFGNLHWSGNFDEVQDFEIQIERLNGGDGLVSGVTFDIGHSPLNLTTTGLSTDLDALAAYVNGLGKDTVKKSPRRLYNGELSQPAIRGRVVFESQNCQSCHLSDGNGNDSFRDGLTHDVGTIKASSGNRLGGELTAIRTPSLIELWDSAPYFHDGSAQTLEQVLSTGSHAVEITEQEQTDLIQYLMSIDKKMYIEDVTE